MFARRTLFGFAVAAAGTLALPAQRAGAQYASSTLDGIPQSMFPPPGTCRIWLDDVAPVQQPPLMDCGTAQSRVPANARVVYGVTARRSAELIGSGAADRRPPTGVDRRPPDYPVPVTRDRPAGGQPATGEPIATDPTGAPCTDRDRDSFCDELRLPTRAPSRMPRMESAVVYQRFRGRAGDVEQWLGERIPLEVRYIDANRDETPERVEWLTPDGMPLQVWVDVNRDGRADQVGAYSRGQLVRVVGGR